MKRLTFNNILRAHKARKTNDTGDSYASGKVADFVWKGNDIEGGADPRTALKYEAIMEYVEKKNGSIEDKTWKAAYEKIHEGLEALERTVNANDALSVEHRWWVIDAIRQTRFDMIGR